MGWFDEQIRLRKQNDERVFEESFLDMAGAVMGRELQDKLENNRLQTQNAITAILRCLHVRSREIPEDITDFYEQVAYLIQPVGVMMREVHLTKGWYKDAAGPMLLFDKETGAAVAAIPSKIEGYTFYDAGAGRTVRIGSSNEGLFEQKAYCFYKPFPLRKIGIRDIIIYMAQTRTLSDYILILAGMAVVIGIGYLSPILTRILYGRVLTGGSMPLLYGISFFIICVGIGKTLFTAVSDLITQRVQTRQNIAVEAAVMMRVLSLPPSFFRKYSSGDLQTRTQTVTQLCKTLESSILNSGLTSVFSLVYITQVMHYTPALTAPALCITGLTMVFTIVTTLMNTNITRESMKLSAQEHGISYAMITGIQKIKLAGAEKRAFARWAKTYAGEAEYLYNPPLLIKLSSVISLAITSLGTVLLYSAAIASSVKLEDYTAFMAAYGMVSGAFLQLTNVALLAAGIKPTIEMVQPLLDEMPETTSERDNVAKLSGNIELNHVYFRYNDDMPFVLNDMNLKIRAGEYVAVVGETGCGKSTLVRTLLGFEKPQKGAVFFDGKDLESLDVRSLRRRIGVVMQNGKLFMGSIYENITISAPWLTLDEAWEAAETAGIAEDIREMPMGMQTMIAEGQGGISGGQKQRLLIARAIASHPKILIFDEATSALDNATQRKVTEALDSYKCTRIVIAHRLSTIRSCDRILVLRGGEIIEDGSYDDLIAEGGYFAELVERQRLDLPDRSGEKAEDAGEEPAIKEEEPEKTGEKPSEECSEEPGPEMSDLPEDAGQ